MIINPSADTTYDDTVAVSDRFWFLLFKFYGVQACCSYQSTHLTKTAKSLCNLSGVRSVTVNRGNAVLDRIKKLGE